MAGSVPNVAVLSRFDVPGGSELRAVYLANMVRDLTGTAVLLTDSRAIPRRLRRYLDPRVARFTGWKDDPLARRAFARSDVIIVVLSNQHQLAAIDYWQDGLGMPRTKRPPRLIFVVNYDLRGLEHMHELLSAFPSVHICLANAQLRQTLHDDARFEALRRVPTSVLPSPIDLRRFRLPKRPDAACGSYSFPCSHKWNTGWPSLTLDACSGVSGLKWRLMGIPRAVARRMPTFTPVVSLPVFAEPVELFLQHVRVFIFFPAWDWQEAWSRSIAEALASGCPVIATDRGGNRDQIVHGHNGFLCADDRAMLEATVALARDRTLHARMSRAAIDCAQSFSYESVSRTMAGLLR